MPYYKDKTGALHFLENADFEHLLPDGCVQITDKDAAELQTPPAPTAEELQATKNAESRAYLAETDWYVIRKTETGVEIPADILAARQAARDAVK